MEKKVETTIVLGIMQGLLYGSILVSVKPSGD